MLSRSVVSDSFVAPGTVFLQAPLPMGFSRQEHWNGSSPPPGDFPNAGIEPRSPALQVDSLHLNHQGSHGRSIILNTLLKYYELYPNFM